MEDLKTVTDSSGEEVTFAGNTIQRADDPISRSVVTPKNATVFRGVGTGLAAWEKVNLATDVEGIISTDNLPPLTTPEFSTPIVGGLDNLKVVTAGTATVAFRGASPWGLEILGNGAADTAYVRTTLGNSIFDNDPKLSISLSNISVPANGGSPEIFMGMGAVGFTGTAHTWTNRHVGFIFKGGSGVLYASQADGTTETRSSSLVTCTNGTPLKLLIICDTAAGSASYYYSTNDGALTLGTTITTNYPTGSTSPEFQISVGMNGLNSNWGVTFVGGLYTRT